MYVLVAWFLGVIALIGLERRSERVRHELRLSGISGF